MPKPKPDQVIRHEIVFGRSERELIKDFQLQLAAKNIATLGTEILKDTTALIALWTLISLFAPDLKFTFNPNASPTEVIESGIAQYQNWEEQRVASGRYDEGASSLFGGVFNLLTNLFRPILNPPELGGGGSGTGGSGTGGSGTGGGGGTF